MELGFEFQYPWALLLLALLPLYSWLRGRVGKAAALTYPDTSLLDGLGRPVREQSGRLRAFLRLLTAALLVIALAGPRTANKEIERETDGLDIMMVVDLSWSMMALDMSTPRAEVTRWQATQSVIYEFLSKRPEDRIGAVVFSGKPYLLSPLTINKIWVEKGIDRMHIGIIQETRAKRALDRLASGEPVGEQVGHEQQACRGLQRRVALPRLGQQVQRAVVEIRLDAGVAVLVDFNFTGRGSAQANIFQPEALRVGASASGIEYKIEVVIARCGL